MKIAAINGFNFHYEMFGYIIDYCKVKNYELTFYCHIGHDNGFFTLYSRVFNDCTINLRTIHEFGVNEKKMYDVIFLLTDDDPYFVGNDVTINNKTICIEHYFRNRRNEFKYKISTRPFDVKGEKDWAIPCYSILNIIDKQQIEYENEIHIAIVGSCAENYNSQYINRLNVTNKKIVVHAFARNISLSKFAIDPAKNIELYIYQNLDTMKLIELVSKCKYILTDHSYDKMYEEESMSGVIPLSFSLLIPLIITKETNKYYKFENVVEFEKNANTDINLFDIDLIKLADERTKLINHNFELFDKYISIIRNSTP